MPKPLQKKTKIRQKASSSVPLPFPQDFLQAGQGVEHIFSCLPFFPRQWFLTISILEPKLGSSSFRSNFVPCYQGEFFNSWRLKSLQLILSKGNLSQQLESKVLVRGFQTQSNRKGWDTRLETSALSLDLLVLLDKSPPCWSCCCCFAGQSSDQASELSTLMKHPPPKGNAAKLRWCRDTPRGFQQTFKMEVWAKWDQPQSPEKVCNQQLLQEHLPSDIKRTSLAIIGVISSARRQLGIF